MLRKRVSVLLATTMMLALMVALSGTALAAPGDPPADPGNKVCAIAAVAIFRGAMEEVPSPGALISTNCVPA